jgi:hypothetical protein
VAEIALIVIAVASVVLIARVSKLIQIAVQIVLELRLANRGRSQSTELPKEEPLPSPLELNEADVTESASGSVSAS